MEKERRQLFRNGALLLLASALLGLVVAAQAPHPAKWMAAHVSGLLTGILLVAFGGLWSELRLAPAVRHRALQMALTAAWLGWAANVFAAAVNFPGPASDPGRVPDATWHAVVFFSLLAVVVPTTIGSFFLAWKGLRD